MLQIVSNQENHTWSKFNLQIKRSIVPNLIRNLKLPLDILVASIILIYSKVLLFARAISQSFANITTKNAQSTALSTGIALTKHAFVLMAGEETIA
jgi:hypothetical protein